MPNQRQHSSIASNLTSRDNNRTNPRGWFGFSPTKVANEVSVDNGGTWMRRLLDPISRIGVKLGLKSSRLAAVFMILLPVFMVAFQNCSGASVAPGAKVGGTGGTGAVNDGRPLPVGVIDEVSPLASWSLSSSKVEVATSVDQVLVAGSCAGQNDTRIVWSLHQEGLTQDPRYSGEAHCVEGQFQLDLRPLSELACGQAGQVVAEIGFSKAVLADVVRRCEPEKVLAAPALKEVLLPRSLDVASLSCRVEVNQSGASCHHSCYSQDGRLVYESDLSGAICQ